MLAEEGEGITWITSGEVVAGEWANRLCDSRLPSSGFNREIKPSESPSQRELSAMIQKGGIGLSVITGKDMKLSVGYIILYQCSVHEQPQLIVFIKPE